jgi:hypothetical protein
MQGRTNNDKALQKALQAAAKMSDVMDRSVTTSFDRPGMNLFIASVAAMALGTYISPIVAAGIFGMGFIVAGKAILAAAACCIVGGTIGFGYSIATSYPSHKFSVASRALSRASNKLPESARTLFQKFNKRAKVLFALAYAAAAQERIVVGKETSRALSNVEDDAYLSLKKGLGTFGVWTRNEFRERKLPRPEVFGREFGEASARVEESVRKTSGNAIHLHSKRAV